MYICNFNIGVTFAYFFLTSLKKKQLGVFSNLYCLIFLCLFNLNFVSEIDDALPGENKKPFHIPNQFLSPKCEDIPCPIIPSISGPCKFEYETQESEPTCPDNEGISQTFGFVRIKRIG